MSGTNNGSRPAQENNDGYAGVLNIYEVTRDGKPELQVIAQCGRIHDNEFMPTAHCPESLAHNELVAMLHRFDSTHKEIKEEP